MSNKKIVLYFDAFDMAAAGITHTPGFTENFLRLCADTGVTTIYWRVSNRGGFDYPSKIEPVGWQSHPSKLANDRFKNYDPLKVAIEKAHLTGLKIYAHVTMFDEGLIYSPSEYTNFAKKHPEYVLVDRQDRKCPFSDREYGSALCYTYPEVRKYRISLLHELFAYELDGLVLDFYRWRESYDPWGGITYGYNKPVVESFRQKHKEDPFQLPYDDLRWLRHKCEDVTTFLREFKDVILKEKPDFILSSFVPRTVQLCLYSGLDLSTWAKEGLMSEIGIFSRFESERNLVNSYLRTKLPVGNPPRITPYPEPLAKSFKDVPFVRVGKGELEYFRSLVGKKCLLLSNIMPQRVFLTDAGAMQLKLSNEEFFQVAQSEMDDGADGIIFDEDNLIFDYLPAIRRLTGKKY